MAGIYTDCKTREIIICTDIFEHNKRPVQTAMSELNWRFTVLNIFRAGSHDALLQFFAPCGLGGGVE